MTSDKFGERKMGAKVAQNMRYCRLVMNKASTLRACAGNSYLQADFIGRSRSCYQEHNMPLIQTENKAASHVKRTECTMTMLPIVTITTEFSTW